MDATEEQVQKYLLHRGYNVQPHPDGRGKTPDFLVGDHIAVEVRRLDQGFTIDGKRESLEQAYIPTRQMFVEMLTSFGPPTAGCSWYVMFDLRRPVARLSTIKKQLRALLADFKATPSTFAGKIKVGQGLTVSFLPAGKAFDQFFVLAGPQDGDAGGWIVSEIIENLKACIALKSTTVARAHAKYPEWWLLLVNRIYPDIDVDDIQEIRLNVVVPDTWRKVIVVSPSDHTLAFEL